VENEWKVKIASSNDLERWMEFVQTVQSEFHGLDLVNDEEYQAAVNKNIRRSTAIYVENKDTSEIIGALMYSPHSFHIGWLAVRPNHRRKGIGTALVRYMFALMRKDVPIRVNVFLETDPPGKVAHAFYMSLGFSPKEIQDDLDHRNAGRPYQVFVKG
jgi:ribosomal protein S18 acetylase RimI-like enzyme